MGTDAPESMGFKMVTGNNVHINLEPETRAETNRPFAALSAGGKVAMPLQEMFRGDYFGSLVYAVRRAVDVQLPQQDLRACEQILHTRSCTPNGAARRCKCSP